MASFTVGFSEVYDYALKFQSENGSISDSSIKSLFRVTKKCENYHLIATGIYTIVTQLKTKILVVL